MKDYMNEKEIIDFIRVYGAENAYKNIAEEWGSRGNLTKDEAKCFKTAATWGKKGRASIEGRMDGKQLQRVLNRAKEGLASSEGLYTINKADLDNIIDSVLFCACSPCKCDHAKDCVAKAFLKRFGVPYFDKKAKGEGQCPYEQVFGHKEKAVVEVKPENVAKLPCFPGERVKVLKDGRYINSYVDHIMQDRKGRWKIHVKATDEYYSPAEFSEFELL